MNQLELPDPGPAEDLPFSDLPGARKWLALQPQAQPTQMQAALYKALAAIDGSSLPPATRLEILDLLRAAVVAVQTAVESRYTRKPLPLPAADAEVFIASRKLWRTLAVAYLRTVPALPPREAVRPLLRAAVALRMEQYAHFLAAYEVPAKLLLMLYGVLGVAEKLGIQHTPLPDPEYPHMGESHIAGHVAWAFMLQFVDPCRLSMAQLAVANRAFSRWRELAGFQSAPDNDPRARALPLSLLLGKEAVAENPSRWLDVRPVARKLRGRIEALEAGETPEALKLGRELSASASIRLLRQLNDALGPNPVPKIEESGPLRLVFGVENIYALLCGEFLNPATPASAGPKVDHQRLAVFGFDNRVTPADSQARLEVPGETWQAEGGWLWRAADAGVRLQSPSLVAFQPVQGLAAKLGVLSGLLVSLNGRLRAQVQWYPCHAQATSIRIAPVGGKASRLPVFILAGSEGLSLILPASAAVRPDNSLVLEGETKAVVSLGEVLERGSDYVRYAATTQ